MLRMETRHTADARDSNLFTNLNVVVDEDEVAVDAAAVAMVMEEDAVMEAVVKAMGRKMTT